MKTSYSNEAVQVLAFLLLTLRMYLFARLAVYNAFILSAVIRKSLKSFQLHEV